MYCIFCMYMYVCIFSTGGAGIAPFKAFVEERDMQMKANPMYVGIV